MASKKQKPRNLPLRPELGPSLGSGQDNAVYDLLHPAEKPHLRIPTGWVVKVNHDLETSEKTQRHRHEDPREAAWRGIQYKRNKYDLLKHFLGDYIPDSAFVLARSQQSGKERFVEMTLQKKVPKFSISELAPEQRQDPRLKANMTDLIGRMQYMYSVLGEVNARTAGHINLDAKLDLGGISDVVRSERLDYAFKQEEVQNVIDSNKSPNLLVDPESMQLYCVDFDQGQWVEGMSDAKQFAFDIDRRNQLQAKAAAIVTPFVIPPPR